jgi:putative addiction module component (TIGR02574 family)
MHLSIDEINRLSPPERLTMIEQLWDSLKDSDVAVTAAQREELDRRMDSFENDRKHGVSWESLKAELAQRLT